MKSHVVIAAALAALAGCTTTSHPWEGLLYPKTGSFPYDIALGHFASLEECRASATALLSKMTPESGSTPDYECGYKCEIANESPPAPGLLAMRLCEKTEK
jgi:hypothetical protein